MTRGKQSGGWSRACVPTMTANTAVSRWTAPAICSASGGRGACAATSGRRYCLWPRCAGNLPYGGGGGAGNKALRRMREGLYSRGAASLLFRSLQGRGQPPPEPGAYAEKTGEKHGAVLRLGLVKPCVSGLSAPGLSGLNINLRLTPVLWGKS